MTTVIPTIPVKLYAQKEDYTCGAAATKMIFSKYNKYKTEQELVDELDITPEKGCYIGSIEECFRNAGFISENKCNFSSPDEAESELDQELKQGRPVMLLLNRLIYNNTPGSNMKTDWKGKKHSYHYVIMRGKDKTGYFFNDPDPEVGFVHVAKEDVMKAWYRPGRSEMITCRLPDTI